jgi:hypothetical protein
MNSLSTKRLITALFLLGWSALLTAKEWQVGPSRPFTSPAVVSSLLSDGDTLSIDAALYSNHPQVYFGKNNLLIRGVGGRPRLEGGTALANNSNGKALFVLGGNNVTVENIEFALATVPDHNGAGIRQEGCPLYVRNCYFIGNEMGILGGNYANCTVVLEHNQFYNNGSPANPGYQHNVYINKIDSLIFRYNLSLNAVAEGHELKSRARHNFILYNHLSNRNTIDSRTIDVPNGGTAVLVGNIIEQGPTSANSNLVGYGMEGLSSPAPHQLWIAYNTFINKKSTGNFVQAGVGTETVFLKNNLFAGANTSGILQGNPLLIDSSHNLAQSDLSIFGFTDAASYNYHLEAYALGVNQGQWLSEVVGGYPLQALFQQVDSTQWESRPIVGIPDIGAFEYSGSTRTTTVLSTEGLIVWPNPCHDRLFLRTDEPNIPYQIVDLQGGYRQGGLTQQHEVPLASLPAGSYVLCVQGKRVLVKKW